MSGIAYDRLVSAVNNESFKQPDVSWVGAHSPSSFSFRQMFFFNCFVFPKREHMNVN